MRQLHSSRPCLALPPLLFTLAKPLARSTWTVHTRLDMGWVSQSMNCPVKILVQGDSCSSRKSCQSLVASTSLGTEGLAQVCNSCYEKVKWSVLWLTGRGSRGTKAKLECSVASAWLVSTRAMPVMCLSVQVIFCSFGFPTQFVGILALCYYWWKSTFFWPTQVFIQWRVEKGSLLSAQIKSRRSAGAQLFHFFDSHLSLF